MNTTSDSDQTPRTRRIEGALVGSVVGDALGAPYEFGPEGQFSARFPSDAGEMVAGGVWAVGEWTDDTQMALIIAEILLERGGVDLPHVFEQIQRWAFARPKDIGIQTRHVLTCGKPFDRSAKEHFDSGRPAAGNGSLMRTTPAALWFAVEGTVRTMTAARRLSDLTHGDPAAGAGCAIYHELVRLGIDGDDPLRHLESTIDKIPEDLREQWSLTLAPEWLPELERIPNGAVWPTLGIAVWALRRGWPFPEAMRKVIDLGGDTDTIAAVTGGLLGAVQGIDLIPTEWITPLHGELIGRGPSPYTGADLPALARRLASQGSES